MHIWHHKPTYEEYCEVLGYDPADEWHWENWAEFTAEWEDEDYTIKEGN